MVAVLLTETRVPNMSKYCIQTQGLYKQFGGKLALDSFSLTIGRGGIHAVVGSNGAGKSTLFRLLLGTSTPSAGTASVFGEDSQNLSPNVRAKLGYVNEEHTLPNWMTAQQATDFQRHYYPKWQQGMYDKLIGYFDVDPKQKISSLSRGERAGVNLAIAFAQNPELLILDEPTLGLDIVSKQNFLEAVMFTETNDTTIVYCSHQMDEIERVADRLIVMEKGKLQNNSSPDQFVDRVSYWIADFGELSFGNNKLISLLNVKIIDGQHHIWAIDQGHDFGQVLKKHGAVSVKQSGVGLGRAVNAFLSKNHKISKHIL